MTKPVTYTGDIGQIVDTVWVDSKPDVTAPIDSRPVPDFDALLGFGPDYKAMVAKRPGWYSPTGHEYRLWGPPTARRLRTLSSKTIVRKMRRAHRQGRHIHACDLAMQETRQPRADAAAARRAGQAQARYERKRRKHLWRAGDGWTETYHTKRPRQVARQFLKETKRR